MDFNEYWNLKQRPDLIRQIQKNEYDIVIIGGGITGAGVAREAALRGLSFCLIDKNDFGYGTSSRSSKLAHGGLRYLSRGDFGLVRLSTTERNWLRCHFPNLVRPSAFVTNAYKGSGYSAGKIRLGMFLYQLLSDTFSRFKNFKKPVFIAPDRIRETEPNLLRDKLELSALYYDTNIDDSRLTIETIKEALELSGGKSAAVSYVQAVDFMQNVKGMIYGVLSKDAMSGQRFGIRGKAVVNAAGVWADRLLELTGEKRKFIRPTKGVHVVVPNARIGNRNAVALQSVDDGRSYFILHRGDVSVIGTTDTDYKNDLDDPFCTRKECDYLFRTVNLVFPNARLTDTDVISTYAGIRPLVSSGGKNESSVSRKHRVIDSGMGLVTVVGGKLTEFRKMAEDTLFEIFRKRYLRPVRMTKNFSKKPYLVGMTAEDFNKAVMDEKLAENASYEQLRHLHQQYGRNALRILRSMKRDPLKGKPLLDGHPFCTAELEYILDNEMVCSLADIMCRRTEMQMLVAHQKQKELARTVAEIASPILGWNQEKMNQEIRNYLNIVEKSVRFMKPSPSHAPSGAPARTDKKFHDRHVQPGRTGGRPHPNRGRIFRKHEPGKPGTANPTRE